jgi:C1A family cysteine protease
VKDFQVTINDNKHKEHLFVNWVINDKMIDVTNARNLTYSLGHNHFSGMDSNEFSEYMGFQDNANTLGSHINISKLKERLAEVKCLKSCVDEYDSASKLSTISCVKDCIQENVGLSMNNLPESVDWVKAGAVTPVKNQGQCGSCWSFSTTGALEGAYFNTYGTLPSFSEQQLVDCDNRKNGGKDMGCNGGLMDNAFAWIEKNGGLCSEADYPYTSGDTKTAGTCQTTCDVVDNSVVTTFTDVHPSNDVDMMTALSKQTVSIAIEADQQAFQLYKSGVFTGTCGTNLDHGVLTVGYGTLDGQDYYKVKNSWGATWGDDGYILLGRGDEFNKGQGQCGMLLQASYPEV